MNDKTRVFNQDCMIGMKEFPDKYFDLAIVDPPYGIDKQLRGGRPFGTQYRLKGWDTPPGLDYFTELYRVSNNQIIWGGNYFGLGRTRGFVIWDKQNDDRDFSECEFAWTSFDKVSRMYRKRFIGKKESEHPTEKPISLYQWLLKNYAKPGDKILDTHLGSQSSRIAAFDMGFDFTGYELDKDYFEAGNKRFAQHVSQFKLFTPEQEQAKPQQLNIW